MTSQFEIPNKMAKLLLLLISTIGFFYIAKADTIDYWHVYYNNTKIKEYNQYSKGEIVLKVKNIKKTDSLTILFFRDTPCSDCKTEVNVENESHFVITKGKGYGTFNPIKISVFDLLLKADRDFSCVYYQERDETETTPKVLLFKVKLE